MAQGEYKIERYLWFKQIPSCQNFSPTETFSYFASLWILEHHGKNQGNKQSLKKNTILPQSATFGK